MIDVTSVVVKEDLVILTGIDLDSIWIHEDAECTEATYKFDTSLAGVRKYLYLTTKNNKKANEFKYMDERLNALLGQTIYLSNNFRVKE